MSERTIPTALKDAIREYHENKRNPPDVPAVYEVCVLCGNANHNRTKSRMADGASVSAVWMDRPCLDCQDFRDRNRAVYDWVLSIVDFQTALASDEVREEAGADE